MVVPAFTASFSVTVFRRTRRAAQLALRRLHHRRRRDFYEVYPQGGRWHGRVWRDGEVAYWQDYGSREVADQQTRALHLTMS